MQINDLEQEARGIAEALMHELHHAGCGGLLLRLETSEATKLVCIRCDHRLSDPREIQHSERVALSPEDKQASRRAASIGFCRCSDGDAA